MVTLSERNVTGYKEFTLGFLSTVTVASSLLIWARAIPSFVRGTLEGYVEFLIPVAVLMASSCLLMLAATFLTRPWLRYGTAAAGVAIPIFALPASLLTIGIFAGAALLAVFASYRMHKEYTHSQGFSVSKIAKAGVPLYFTIAALVVSLFYFHATDEKQAIAAFFPRSLFNVVLEVLASPLRSFTGLPTLSPDATIDEVLRGLAEQTLFQQGIPVVQIPLQELSRLVAAEREELATHYGVRLEGSERINEVLYAVVTKQAEKLLGPYQRYLPLISAVAFFLAFKTLTFPLSFIAVAALALLIKLLRAVKILIIEKQTIEVERLRL